MRHTPTRPLLTLTLLTLLALLAACDDAVDAPTAGAMTPAGTMNPAGTLSPAGTTAGALSPAGTTAGALSPAGTTAGALSPAGTTAGALSPAGTTAGALSPAGAMTPAGTTAGTTPTPVEIPAIDCTGSTAMTPCEAMIQQARRADLIGPDVIVAVEGVISAARRNAEGKISHIVLQADEGGDYSGVWTYVNDARAPDALPTFAEGQRVRLVALTADYFGQRQLKKIEAATVLGQEVVPAPLVVNPADINTTGARAAALEGVLVAVEGVSVTSLTPAAGPGDMEPINEFVVTGDLRVDDYLTFTNPLPSPAVGDAYRRVVGVLRLANNDYKLEPRYAADLSR
jgi:hypothetical protein